MTFNRLESAERLLDRTLAFLPRIDSKMSAILAIAMAELAVFTWNLSVGDLSLWYIDVPASIFLLSECFILYQLYICAEPHLKGGIASLIYFREIANRTEVNFVRDYLALSESDALSEVAGQIWKNSEIVTAKFNALKLATRGILFSLLPWTTILIVTALSHHRLPIAN